MWHKGGVSRQRKRGRLWFIANRNKLRVVARWWPRPLGWFALAFGAARGFVAMVRSADVSAGDWLDLVLILWGGFWSGEPEAVRRRVFTAGRRGFVA